jgi:hypothetical protein
LNFSKIDRYHVIMKRTLQIILIAIGAFFSLCGVYCLFVSPHLFCSSLADIIYRAPLYNYKAILAGLRRDLSLSEAKIQRMSSDCDKKIDEEKSRLDDYKRQEADKNIRVWKNCLDDLANGDVHADFIAKIAANVDSSDILQIDTNDDTLRLKSRNHIMYQENLGCYFSLFQLKKAIPVLETKKGRFSFWKIYGIVNDSVGFALFALLINENQMRIIKRNFLMNMAGMWFHSSSPSGRYFTMDYGCCPGVRDLEIFDEFGNSIHKTEYVEEGGRNEKPTPFWSGDTLVYWKAVSRCNRHDDSTEVIKRCGKMTLEATFLRKTRFYKDHEIISTIGKVYCF